MRYLDTSSLIALYFPEAKSDAVSAHVRSGTDMLALTWLQEIEFTNGLYLKVFRKEPVDNVSTTLERLQLDVESGVFQRIQLSWSSVVAKTMRLSAAHTSAIGTRVLDLLHVAAALELKSTEFITGDERQAKAAREEGLKVAFI